MPDADLPQRRDPAAHETEESLGGVDLGSLFGLAAQLQSQLDEAAEQNDVEVQGVAGGGAVRITATGTGEFRSVHIDASAVDPDDVDLLQDLVLAALHDATRRMNELRAQQLGAVGGGLGDLLGGLGGQGGLGDLADLFSEPRDDDPPTRPG